MGVVKVDVSAVVLSSRLTKKLQSQMVTKSSEELQILKQQFSKKISIFACRRYDVFGDVEVEVGPDLKIVMVAVSRFRPQQKPGCSGQVIPCKLEHIGQHVKAPRDCSGWRRPLVG